MLSSFLRSEMVRLRPLSIFWSDNLAACTRHGTVVNLSLRDKLLFDFYLFYFILIKILLFYYFIFKLLSLF